ncbi:RHS repeat domain-containing protein [Rickettsiella endosymbiont of Rhagonycha lignosa]|uniref:RHS repeat domain-containing protein n=1 Tax=Rickettsiella endosymbiont of Rhagonycha lignosa TaxID=3077937 RepID=UPI00313E76C0
MDRVDYSLYEKTPEVSVVDNRGQIVREIRYHRHPDTPVITDERIIRHRFNVYGQLTHSIDPRFFELMQSNQSIQPNFVYCTALSGEVLRTESADSGTSMTLNDIAGRPMFSINALGITQTYQYETDTQLGRLLSIHEQVKDKPARITERLVWAGNSQTEKNQNLVGQCIRHYDTAGLMQINRVLLTDTPQLITQQLLKADTNADWQGDDEFVWSDQLSTDVFTTQTTTNATGALLTQRDAKDNLQRWAYNVAGLLCASWLTQKGQAEQIIVRSLSYSAMGQKLHEEYGNGVIASYTYEPESQRLLASKIERPRGHALGAKILQDMRYAYDAVGNVLSVHNVVGVTRFWRNQKVDAASNYIYDSLYQLISGSGREMANIGQQDYKLPAPLIPLPTDNSTYTNYTRTYAYDRGGNLTQFRHSAPATTNNYTTHISVSDRSNRAVLSTLAGNPANIDSLFDKAGQQVQRLGQSLHWTGRGELDQVEIVNGDSQSTIERYTYDAQGQRRLKISQQPNGNTLQTRQVCYLPGLELRTRQSGETMKESLQVITVGEAGQAQVRVLHWQVGQPEGIPNDQIRYNYSSETGNRSLELDNVGRVISLEEFYPYGGTALWAASSQTEADYKFIRYSGKERDLTGLYYYGSRYYLSTEGRWLSPDPAGTGDGLNLYGMVANNPILYTDADGQAKENRFRDIYWLATYLVRKITKKDAASSFAQAKKITLAVMGGLALAGIAGLIVGTAGASVIVTLAVLGGAALIGAIAGWNLDRITSKMTAIFARFAQDKSPAVNIAMGATIAVGTARLHGASTGSLVLAGAFGGSFGYLGYAVGDADRGAGGAHGAGTGLGMVDIIGGSGTSTAMRVSAGGFGGAGGFLTGTSWSAEAGNNAALGSFLGGSLGRLADNVTSIATAYAYQRIGRPLVAQGVSSFINFVGKDNFVSQFVGKVAGKKVAGWFATWFKSSNDAGGLGGTWEWTGSATGAAIGGVGTALVHTSDTHFNTRMGQLGGLLNLIMTSALDYTSRWGIRYFGSRVARDVAISGATLYESLA